MQDFHQQGSVSVIAIGNEACNFDRIKDSIYIGLYGLSVTHGERKRGNREGILKSRNTMSRMRFSL